VVRRYNKGAFKKRLQSMGLEPLRLSYSNSFLFPVVAVRRLLAKMRDDGSMGHSDVQPMPEPLNTILGWVLSSEAPIVASRGMPMGLSTLTLAQKK
jgi:hypothetical protein